MLYTPNPGSDVTLTPHMSRRHMYVTTQLSHTHETEARACRSATRISLSRTHIAQPHAYRSAARMSLSHTHVPRMSHTGTLKEAAADGTRKVAVERERAAKKLASAVETYGVLQVELAQARQELAERQEGTCPVSRVVELQEQLSRVHREREQQAKEAKARDAHTMHAAYYLYVPSSYAHAPVGMCRESMHSLTRAECMRFFVCATGQGRARRATQGQGRAEPMDPTVGGGRGMCRT